jgi:hypothetical protein
MTQLPVAHVLCATLPSPIYFAKFGSLLNYMSFATAYISLKTPQRVVGEFWYYFI